MRRVCAGTPVHYEQTVRPHRAHPPRLRPSRTPLPAPPSCRPTQTRRGCDRPTAPRSGPTESSPVPPARAAPIMQHVTIEEPRWSVCADSVSEQ